MFGALAVWGAITDIDLSKVGSIAFMALIGLTGDAAGRTAIMGALALYLDFINLFLFLLRIFGQQR